MTHCLGLLVDDGLVMVAELLGEATLAIPDPTFMRRRESPEMPAW